MTISLKFATPACWVETVLADFDSFLVDHAAAEKKASGMAMSMLSHYPDKPDIVRAMIDLGIEELTHFREVVKILAARGLRLGPDKKDPYVNALRLHARKGSREYLLDRLLLGAIIETRGCERFGLVADALPPGELKTFYQIITRSENKHGELFIDLGKLYFNESQIEQRLEDLLLEEAGIVESLPITAALH